MPILQVADAMLLHTSPPLVHASPGYWKDIDSTPAPRVYNQCWFLNPRLKAGRSVAPPIFPIEQDSKTDKETSFNISGILPYTPLEMLMNELLRLSYIMQFTIPRSTLAPFKILDKDAFEISTQTLRQCLGFTTILWPA